MVKSAPRVSFSVGSINYGTIDVGTSAATTQLYNIWLTNRSNVMTEALFMSISFAPLTNAAEARLESWTWISTTLTSKTYIGSATAGPEASIGSVVAGRSRFSSQISVHVRTNILVPSNADTAGAVTFNLHHRYQYTGYDD